ncbi:unnamed protein product, partial [Meganyctiphanes norvegica]
IAAIASGLECYTCVTMGQGDNTCLERPDDVPLTGTTDCKKEGKNFCCTIIRTENKHSKLTQFSRGCMPDCKLTDDTLFSNSTSNDFITFTTKCTTPLCNVQDGSKPLPEQGKDRTDTHMIKGIPGNHHSGSTTRTPQGLCMWLSAAAMCHYFVSLAVYAN